MNRMQTIPIRYLQIFTLLRLKNGGIMKVVPREITIAHPSTRVYTCLAYEKLTSEFRVLITLAQNSGVNPYCIHMSPV